MKANHAISICYHIFLSFASFVLICVFNHLFCKTTDASPIEPIAEPGSAVGFLPNEISHQGSWLSINLMSRTISLMEGDKTLSTSQAQGLSSLKPGKYELRHKQRNPLWYAPDSYFVSRGVPVPPEGDKNRYLRGAFGDFALFIEKDLPIHCSPVWTPEIGGIQISEGDLSKMYYLLPVGAPIEVR